jgi:hypothetical protein
MSDSAQFLNELLTSKSAPAVQAKQPGRGQSPLLALLPAMVELGATALSCCQCKQLMGYKYNVIGQEWLYCSNACRQKAYRIRHGQRYDKPGRPAKVSKS